MFWRRRKQTKREAEQQSEQEADIANMSDGPSSEESSLPVFGEVEMLIESDESVTEGAAEEEISFLELPIPPLGSSLFDAQYDRSIDQVWHELRRIDWLIKAQIVRWRALIGRTKPSEEWGTVYVPEAEVGHLFHHRAVMPDDPDGLFGERINGRIREYEQRAQEEARRIEARIRETEVELLLRTLVEQLELSRLERDILLICLWGELDERYRRVFGYLMDDSTRLTPSIHLITQILIPVLTVDNRVHLDDIRVAFEPESPLRRWHIITLSDVGQSVASFGLSSVKLDDRIVTYLIGEDVPDTRLAELVTLLPFLSHAEAWKAVKQDSAQKQILLQLEMWMQERPGNSSTTLLLRGGYGSGRLQAAQAIYPASNQPPRFMKIDMAAALRSAVAWDELVARVYREALLRNWSPVYWSNCEVALDDPIRWQTLINAAETYRGVTFLESTLGWSPAGNFRGRGQGSDQAFTQVEFPVPSYELRIQLWREALARVSEFNVGEREFVSILHSLASSFQFTEGQLADAVTAARALALYRNAYTPVLRVDDLFEGCRAQSSHDLQTLAKRIEPRKNLTLEDLVLPPSNRRQFEELQSRIRYRNDLLTKLGFGQRFQLGTGLIALFTGSSGTGKTMGAEIVAHSMGVAIYRVDLSSLVSKYVGETEKNLNRIFALAEDSGAILFFDEADALFGKRGDVKDAQDRWANLEVNYLLQRVEQYSGVVILASNLRQNIDDAFARRIHVLIDFPFPDEVHRLEIWERAMQGRDETQPDIRFPDAEYHGRFTPEYCNLLKAKVRNAILNDDPRLSGNLLEDRVQKQLAALSRDEIRKLLDPELARLSPEQRADLLYQETQVLAKRFQLAGGNIKNVVVDAAVRAFKDYDEQGGELHILLRQLVAGITREYQKLGKPVTRGDFGDPFYDWAKQDILL